MRQHIGSHNNHARPDGQMGVRHRSYLQGEVFAQPTSTQRQARKAVANAKRRQRDKTLTD